MHNKRMVTQVVLRPFGDAASVHIDEVDSMDDPKVSRGGTLHLGSQDLVRFAGYAVANGFRVTRFSVADGYLNPVSTEESQEISDRMIDVLEEFDSDELEVAMTEDFEGLYVVGVELLSLREGWRIAIRREGYVDTSQVNRAEALIDSAVRKLQLT